MNIYRRETDKEQIIKEENENFLGCNSENFFLRIEVTPDETEKRFRFKDNLSTVREKLLEICKQIVIVSHRIQRPEVGLGKSDKEFER